MSHDHGHHHGGGHSHAHAPADFGRAFLIGILLNSGFVALEFAMGWVSGSLALISDAGHNLGDVLGLVLAWAATILARRPAGGRYTYGLKRSTILAALANAIILLVGVGAIGLEAISRLRDPRPVEAGVVAWVSGLGILINGATALLFMAGRKTDLNIRGAFLHMAADAAVSLGVMVAGLVILFTGAVWIDPVVSLIVLAVILWGTWGLFTESLGLAMDAAPENAPPDKVRTFLGSLPGVVNVHDVHVWALSTTETALTAHVVRGDEMNFDDAFLALVKKEVRAQFGVTHVTVQIETSSGDCRERP